MCPVWQPALSHPTSEGVYTLHERKRHQELQVHLEMLLARDPDTFSFVVLDHASAHTTEKLDAFQAQHQQRLEMVFLPVYSLHLNLIECLWRLMRGQMTRNQFYQDVKALCEAVVEWLEKFPFSQFCSLMGIKEEELIFV